MNVMARPPLVLGTSGSMRTYRTPAGWRARTAYRDYDGVTREIQRHAPTKAKAERALAEAVRDRARYDAGTEIRKDMRVSALAEAWFRDVSAGDRGRSVAQRHETSLFVSSAVFRRQGPGQRRG